MYLDHSIGEFTVRISQISIETDAEDVCISWSGISTNLKCAFEEIHGDIEASGHIFKSGINRYGNFDILPYDRNSDFYSGSIIKPNIVGIESYEKKSLSIDSVVTEKKFNFLIDILSKFEIMESTPQDRSLIWLKARLNLSDETISNSMFIAPSKSIFFSNGNLRSTDKYFEFGTSVDLSFTRIKNFKYSQG